MKNVLKFGLASLAALALSSTLTNSAAQGRLVFDGTYSVSGKGPTGELYQGTMTIAPQGDGYSMVQEYGSDVWRGVGNDIKDYLAGAYMVSGIPSVSIYRVTGANTMTGFWQNFDNNVEGSEEATLSGSRTFSGVSSAPSTQSWNFKGTYGVRGSNPDGTTYDGTMQLENFGNGYHAQFTSRGQVWRGIGTYLDDFVAIAWQAGNTPMVSIFSGNPSTGSLQGFWLDFKSNKEGKEVATRR